MSHGERDELRSSMRAQRMALGPAERIAAARGVGEQLETLPEFLTDLRIAVYWAVRGELPLSHALPALVRRGQIAFLPVLASDQHLRFAPWLPGQDLAANRFGIPEPDQNAATVIDPHGLDVVLVPLLAFDRRGHRLGSGGGWYDRSFAFLHDLPRPAHTLLVGIGYSFQEVSMLPVEAHDVRLDFIVTERELIDCNPAIQ
ncbi:MAG: 5-formyltetrahydrofolate cyclo-ligase [Rhodanobacteraceae bacterium]|nr:5-formyltetrahydrofolate cyclo-ligase [Rhodanobacteraceae bacterium]MBK7044224.1 5-formyltetrahydrofolate cyclo-ligase [Rhodanobacteraceae bacterium]MBP9154243.1 5-formyltetrahydrofolate cyclo-ligase [Xanthomonadales bacterium]HQW80354.1 5-formyltetrahydrofolate cyclo-ligase [Pseudomonadota bacterium]